MHSINCSLLKQVNSLAWTEKKQSVYSNICISELLDSRFCLPNQFLSFLRYQHSCMDLLPSKSQRRTHKKTVLLFMLIRGRTCFWLHKEIWPYLYSLVSSLGSLCALTELLMERAGFVLQMWLILSSSFRSIKMYFQSDASSPHFLMIATVSQEHPLGDALNLSNKNKCQVMKIGNLSNWSLALEFSSVRSLPNQILGVMQTQSNRCKISETILFAEIFGLFRLSECYDKLEVQWIKGYTDCLLGIEFSTTQ